MLGERHNSPGIWDVVKWELSTALFTMATILVEHPDPALVRIINYIIIIIFVLFTKVLQELNVYFSFVHFLKLDFST